MRTQLLFAASVAVLLAALPAVGRAQQLPRPRPKAARPLAAARARLARIQALRLGRTGPRVLRASAATGTEVEPNDSLPIADSVALGDTIAGTIAPTGDVDWFTFDVPNDTTIELDVNANRSGSSLDAVLYLFTYRPDTLTDSSLALVASDDDTYGLDSHIEYHAAPGRYYAALIDYSGSGGPGFFYTLSFGRYTAPPLGPGDSTHVYAIGLGLPYGAAAGPAGELYVTDVESLRLLRVNLGGAVSPVASLPAFYPFKAVVDGFGNVLVTAQDTAQNFGVVERVTPGGSVSTFATGFQWVAGITVGPDGDVWVLGGVADTPTLFRYDPFGARKDSIDIAATNAFYYAADLAFSPGGVLHFSNGADRIFTLVNRVPQQVILAAPYMESLAFDRDGYLYVSNASSATVALYSPTYAVVSDPFARTNFVTSYVIALAFGRDGTGAMTSRLFATNIIQGALFEMNPVGMRAPGWRVGVDFLAITTASLRSGTMGTDYADTLAVQSPPGTPVWSLAHGALPGGLTLAAATGVLAGTLTASGTFPFTVRVDAGGRFGFRSYTLTVERPTVTVSDAAGALLGGVVLAPDLERFLDFQGNRNGRYDVGDFRAYLRAQGQLPAATTARKARP